MLSMLMTLWLALSDKPARRAVRRRRPAFRGPMLEALEESALASSNTAVLAAAPHHAAPAQTLDQVFAEWDDGLSPMRSWRCL